MQNNPTGNSGRLKIFLGYAPTVGKSHAMLDAAIRKKMDGIDVFVGCLASFQDAEINTLLEHVVEGEEYPVTAELDLDNILERKPQLAIIDELAHKNPTGFRHPRRYQDVQELLSAGIDVFTTLDVHELESQRDLISTMIGTSPKATVPDLIFHNASIIEFVDLPPEEIIQRINRKLESGEMDPDEVSPYLSMENLSRLREIALKRATGIIESPPYDSRTDSTKASSPQSVNQTILVCVSSHPLSEKLVRAGKRLADENHCPWYVLYIETPDRVIPIYPQREMLEATLKLAEDLGGEVIRRTALDVPSAISSFATQCLAAKIIIGAPQRSFWKEWFGRSDLDRLVNKYDSGEIVILKEDKGSRRTPEISIKQQPSSWTSYLKAAGIVFAATAVSFPLHLIIEPVNLVMLYLVAVMACAFYLGRGPGILATVLGVLSFDYFMVAPRFTLTVADTQYLLTFLGLFITSLVVSGLAGQIRAQVNASRQREDHTASLYTLSQELTSTYDRDAVIKVMINQIQRTFVRNCIIWLKDDDQMLPFTGISAPLLDQRMKKPILWVMEHRLPAGNGTDTFPDSSSSYYPMIVGNHCVGVLEVKDVSSTILMNSEKRKLLEAYCGMAAMAIERTRLVEEQKKAQLTFETERLQNALLSSISHDLRTPLATITGVLTSLRESEQPEAGASPLDGETRIELIDSGWEEAERLNRLVGNLLDISRLESGFLRLNLQYGDLEGIIGAVIGRFKNRLDLYDLHVSIPEDLPQVLFDPGLIEQLMYNIMDNAIKYSPADKMIEIKITFNEIEVIVSIKDQGTGITPGDLEKVFDKFYRTRSAASISGSGLGLSICKGIIQAHHGRIWAEVGQNNRGSIIHFTLPISKKEVVL